MRIFSSKIISIITTLLLLQGFYSHAGEVEYIQKHTKANVQVGTELVISDPRRNDPNVGIDYVHEHKAIIALVYGREQRTDVAGSNWFYELTYDLVDIDNGSVIRTGIARIENSDAKGTYENISVHESVSGRVKIIIRNIQQSANVPDDIRLELRMRVERYDFLNPQGMALANFDVVRGPIINTNSSIADVKEDQVQARWAAYEGAEYYELEWVYWDGENTINIPSDDNELFEQAIRVETKLLNYTLDLVYPTGIVFFRVRPVGRFIQNVNGDYSWEKRGNWSEKIPIALFPGFEETKNWQFTRTYAEEGKYKEIINYFDDGMKSRQSLTVLNSESTTIVAEHVYDAENRTTLSVLPVPVDQTNETESPLSFGANVDAHLISTGGVAYDRTDFDKAAVSNSLKADPFPSDHIANRYYSNLNPFTSHNHRNYIPDAELYPIAQVEYLNDGTGRIRRQSGVGAFYQLESGKESKYYYASPTNTELKRLFGANVGEAKYYRKLIVVDANGQQAITYTDQAGQTIATALSGDTPDNVQDIDGSRANITVDLMGNNQKSAVSRTSTTVHQLFCDKQAKVHQFNYDLTQAVNIVGDGGECIGCTYMVEFSIEDENGTLIDITPPAGGGNAITTYSLDFDNGGTCNGANYVPSNHAVSFTATLPEIGTYTIRKILTVTGPNMEDITGQALAAGTLQSQDDFVANYISTNFDSTACEPCNDAFKIELCKEIIALENPSLSATDPIFIGLVDDCMNNNDDCDGLLEQASLAQIYNNNLDCESLLEQMKKDLSPSQTGHSATDGCMYNEEFYTAAFSDVNGSFIFPTLSYVNATGTTINLNFQNYSDVQFIEDPANWQSSWVDDLVTLHPDYDRCLQCQDPVLTESKLFDFELARFDTWAEVDAAYGAQSNSFADRLAAILSHDPYFINSTANTNAIQTALSNYCHTMASANNGSVPGTITCLCGDVFCYIDNLNPPTPGQTNAPPAQPFTAEELWDLFRGIYANEKKKIEYANLPPRKLPVLAGGNTWTGATGCPERGGEPQVDMGGGATAGVTTLNSNNQVLTAVNVFTNQNGATGSACATICDNNTSLWIEQLCPSLQDNSPFYSVLFGHLKDYCLSSCGDATHNPLGYLLQEDVDDALANIMANGGTPTPNEPLEEALALIDLLASSGGLCDVDWQNNPLITSQTTVYCQNTSFNSPHLATVSTAKCQLLPTILAQLNTALFPVEWADANGTVSSSGIMLHDVNSSNYHIPSYNAHLVAGKPRTAAYNTINTTALAGVFPVVGGVGATITGVHLNNAYNYSTHNGNNISTLDDIDRFIRLTGSFPSDNSSTECRSPNNAYTSFGIEFVDMYNGEGINPFEIISIDASSYDCNNNSINLIVVDQSCTWTGAGSPGTACGNTGTKFVKAVIRIEIEGCGPQWESLGNETWQVKTPSVDFDPNLAQIQCWQQQLDILAQQATQAYADYQDQILTELLKKDNCLDIQEAFNVTYENREGHYTLYYYDEAGNLIQTIPPAGVQPLADTEFNDGIWNGTNPTHLSNQITTYKYNTLGQVIEKQSPDGGKTVFWYDYAQRLRLSQRARYLADPAMPSYGVGGDYAYAKFDKQGRSTETGRLTNYTVDEQDLNCLTFPDYVVNSPVDNNNQPRSSRMERIVTEYDELEFTPNSFSIPYTNSRGRVVRTYNDHIATYFAYDIHGNVAKLHHQIANFGAVDIEYEYDLITGNVNQVAYQKNTADQFFHRYRYDADNRLVKTLTSKNRLVWETDARYFYYPHGPLARCEKGHDKVEGMDYFYNLQGWIKGVNNTAPTTDIGKDGLAGGMNQWFSKDQCAYYLGYHKKDYQPIASSISSTLGVFDLNNNATGNNTTFDADIKGTNGVKGLYNGNIAYMLTYLPELAASNSSDALQAMVYQYDALHRIKQAKSYDYTGGTWTSNNKFNTTYKYDPNGNIDELTRNAGNGILIDNLKYHYDVAKPNRLNRVEDFSNHNVANLGDLENQNIFDKYGNNYAYDPIGNLTQDLSEEIETITWNYQNKVERVIYQNSSSKENLNYIYDPSGNRLMKTRQGNDGLLHSTVYIRDAAGNILATYQMLNSPVNATTTSASNGPQLQTATPVDLEALSPQEIEQMIVKLPQSALTTVCAQTVNASPNEVLAQLPSTSTVTTASPALLEQELMVMPQAQAVTVMANAIANMSATQLSAISSLKFYARHLEEVVLYGSSRIGVENSDNNWHNYTFIPTIPSLMSEKLSTLNHVDWRAALKRGNKVFESSNHLGNVLVVCSDKKLGTDSNGDGFAELYNAQVLSANDYYPFGWNMPGRQLNPEEYRFGMNGQEKSPEISEGHATALFWEYDGRLTKRWNLDPRPNVSISPYATFGGNPILVADPKGDTIFKKHIIKNSKKTNVMLVHISADTNDKKFLKFWTKIRRKGWSYVVTDDLKEGAEWINKNFGERSIDDLFLRTHSGGGPESSEHHLFLEKNMRIFSHEIAGFTPDIEKSKNIYALKITLNSVKEGGTVVFSGCGFGYCAAEQRESHDMINAFSTLATHQHINLYVNKNFTHSLIPVCSSSEERLDFYPSKKGDPLFYQHTFGWIRYERHFKIGSVSHKYYKVGIDSRGGFNIRFDAPGPSGTGNNGIRIH